MSVGTSHSHDAVPKRAWHLVLSPMQRWTVIMYSVGFVIAVGSWTATPGPTKSAPEQSKQPLTVPEQEQLAANTSRSANVPSSRPLDMQWTPDGFDPKLYDRPAPPSYSEMPGIYACGTRVRLCARQAKAHIEELLSVLASWRTQCASLGQNDSGRRIAAKQEYLELAIPALRRKRPTDDELIQLLAEIETHSTPWLKEGIEHLIAESDVARVVAIRDAIQSELQQLEVDRLVLESLLLETAEIQPGEYTIEESLNQRRTERETNRQAQLAKAEREAIAQFSAERQKAIDERIAKDAEAERQRLASERASAARNVPSPTNFIPGNGNQLRKPTFNNGQRRKPSYSKPPENWRQFFRDS